MQSKPLGRKLNITAAATSMVSQPCAVLGDAPKNPRFYPIPRDSAPFGPNTAEVENIAFPKHRCNPPPQMNLPLGRKLTLKNLDFQLIFERNPSKATVSESGRQLHISKFLRLSLTTPDGFRLCYSF